MQLNEPFVDYLYSLAEGDRRGAMADLRRGLGEPPGSSPSTFPYVAPFIKDSDRDTWREKAHYLVACLFAYYQAGGAEGVRARVYGGNFGAHLRQAVQQGVEEKSLQPRVMALLEAHRDDLPVLLRHMVSFLKSKSVPLNWDQLLRDLLYWNAPSRFVQKQWADSFWGNITRPDTPQSDTKDL